MERVHCKISQVDLIEDDVLLIDIEAEKNFELEDFQELKDAAKKIGGGRKFYNLINVGEFTLPSRAAREASCSKKGAEFKMADAFILTSLPQKILANFMIRVNRPTVPTKYFEDVDKAIEWIQSLRNQEKTRVVRMA